MMKSVRLVLAVLLILVGGTFALQGLNVLPGSFMSGRPEWFVIGTLGVLVGMALLVFPRPGRR